MKLLSICSVVMVLTLAIWECGVRPFVAPAYVLAKDPAAAERDNEELARLYTEDQADRKPEGGKDIDWDVVLPRDRKREARVKELYEKDKLRTGKDYYHAAMVLQHAAQPEDFLLAHELCIVAVAKGEKKKALWLAAASEDRFLMHLERPQRFGTQYRGGPKNERIQLYKVGPGVTDALRKEFHAPTLAEAKAREAMFNPKPK
jgi:hypothetical protein